MFLARLSYDVLPVHRQSAIGFIRREVEAARASGLKARLLVPLTRGPGGAALVEGPYTAETFPVRVEDEYVVVEA